MSRPLSVLTIAQASRWDIALVDGSVFGRDVLRVLAGVTPRTPVLGLGWEGPCVDRSISLPFEAGSLAAAIDGVVGERATALILKPERRLARANGREVVLTRVEFRLLQVLMAVRPREVPTLEAMQAVWGESEGGETARLRGHVRNLRQKLAQIGVSESLLSHRGTGYSLAH